MDDQPTRCGTCGTPLLSAAGHICPGAKAAAEDLGAAMPATLDEAAATVDAAIAADAEALDRMADLEAARATIDAGQPHPRPALRFPLEAMAGDYSPDPPSRPAAEHPAASPPAPDLAELVDHLGAAGDALANRALALTAELAAERRRTWGDRLGQLAAELPAGLTLSLTVTDAARAVDADLDRRLQAELARVADHLGGPSAGVIAAQLAAHRDPARERTTIELRHP